MTNIEEANFACVRPNQNMKCAGQMCMHKISLNIYLAVS